MVLPKARQIFRPRNTLDIPRGVIGADGRVGVPEWQHHVRTLTDWSKGVHDHIERNTARPALFTAVKAIPTGVGSTGIDNLAEIISNPILKYDVNVFGVTLSLEGVYNVEISSTWEANATGVLRQVIVQSSQQGLLLAPSAGGGTINVTLGSGASRLYNPTPFDTLTVLARQNSGVDLDITVWLTITYYGTEPLS